MTNNEQKQTTKDSFVRRVAAHLTARALWEGLKALADELMSSL